MTYRITILHGTDFDARFAHWPGPAYTAVATIEVNAAGLDDALDAAFDRTQHGDRPWTDAPSVTLSVVRAALLATARKTDPTINSSIATRTRSTRVGDVFVLDTGDAFGVASTGFVPLGFVAPAVQDRIAALRADAHRGALPTGALYDAVTGLQDWKDTVDATLGRAVVFGG